MSATNDYIEKYSQDMVDACYGTGLFPSVMMAQGILESGNGTSGLTVKYNNHFGIKCECKACYCKLTRQYVNLTSTEYDKNNNPYQKVSPFRTYLNAFDSFVDRVKFLKDDNPRYKKAGVFSATSPQEQSDALQRAGYATSNIYANQLKKIIADYNLESLDSMPSNKLRLTSKSKVYLIAGGISLAIGAYIFLVIYLRNKRK